MKQNRGGDRNRRFHFLRGKCIFRHIVPDAIHGMAKPFIRPDYSPPQAALVVSWLNGQDEPLPEINMNDWPGRYRECREGTPHMTPIIPAYQP